MSDDLQALEIDFINQPSVEGALRLCDAYLAQKRFIEPAVVCRKALKMAPTDLRIRLMLARVYFEQGKAGRAQQELSALLAESPNHAEALNLMGQACLALGQRVEGMGFLEKAAAATSKFNKANADAGRAFLDASDDDGLTETGASTRMADGRWTEPDVEGSNDAAAATDGDGGRSAGGSDQRSRRDKKKIQRRTHRLELPDLHPRRRFPPALAMAVGVVLVLVTCWWVFHARNQARHSEHVGQLSGAIVPLLHQDRASAYRQALMVGEQIVSLEPHHRDTLSQLAFAAAVLGVEHGDTDALQQARTYLQRALAPAQATEGNEHAAAVPSDPWRLAASGLLAYHDQEYAAGHQVLQSAIDQGMNQPMVLLEAFRLLAADRAQSDDAVVNGLDALSSTDDVRVQNFLGWSALEQDDMAQAKQHLIRAQTLQHSHEGVAVGLLLSEIFNRDISASVQASLRRSTIEHDLSRLIALPDSELSPRLRAMAYLGRSHYWLILEDADNADKDFLAAINKDPENATLYYRHGQRLVQLGNMGKGKSLLEEAVQRAPHRADYRVRLAAVQVRTGDLAQAEENLRRATEHGASASDVTWLRAELWSAQKRVDQALAAYQSIGNNDTHYIDAQIGIASLLRQQGESVRAAAHLKDVMEHMSPSAGAKQRANLLCALGDAYEQNNDTELAMASYRRGIQANAFAPQCHLALCHMEDEAVARPSCKAYLNLEPHSAQAAQARQRVDQ